MTGVTPQSTTSQLAGQVPKDGHVDEHIPGSFPETPALETTSNDTQDFSVNPIQGSSGTGNPINLAAGEPVPPQSDFTFGNQSIQSGVHDDEQLKAQDLATEYQQAAFGVSPIPATEGAGNPINLAPGEAVPPPSDFTTNTISSTVHDDEELKAQDLRKTLEKNSAQAHPTGVEYPVNPAPITEFGPSNPVTIAPGEKFPTPDEYALASKHIHDKEELKAAEMRRQQALEQNQTFGVNPISGSAGTGNPVRIGSDIPVPAFNTKDINSNVKLDEESYNRSDAQVGGNTSFLPPVVTPQHERDASGAGAFDLPPISKNMIPESSLPMGGDNSGAYTAQPYVQSSGPMSTTAQLAGGVPLEKPQQTQVPAKEAPEIVRESQQAAHFPPEASAVPVEVAEKSQVEDELLTMVPKAPTTSDGTPTTAEVATAVGGAVTAIGGAAAIYAAKAKDAVADTAEQAYQQAPAVEDIKQNLPAPIKNLVAPEPEPEVSNAAPRPVKESIHDAHASPEAASSAHAIAEKQAVEAELLNKVPSHDESGEPAPYLGARVATNDTKPYVEHQETLPADTLPSEAAPCPVQDSIYLADTHPGAAAYETPIREKSVVEQELLQEVASVEATGEHAPTFEGVPSHPNANTGTKVSVEPPKILQVYTTEDDGSQPQRPVSTESDNLMPTINDSRDISPTTRPGERRQESSPVVSSGIETTSTPATSNAANPDSAKDTTNEIPVREYAKRESVVPTTVDTNAANPDSVRGSLVDRRRMPSAEPHIADESSHAHHPSVAPGHVATTGEGVTGKTDDPEKMKEIERETKEARAHDSKTDKALDPAHPPNEHFHELPIPPLQRGLPGDKPNPLTADLHHGKSSVDGGNGAAAHTTPSNSSAVSKDSKKRRSFFGKIKDKLKN